LTRLRPRGRYAPARFHAGGSSCYADRTRP